MVLTWCRWGAHTLPWCSGEGWRKWTSIGNLLELQLLPEPTAGSKVEDRSQKIILLTRDKEHFLCQFGPFFQQRKLGCLRIPFSWWTKCQSENSTASNEEYSTIHKLGLKLAQNSPTIRQWRRGERTKWRIWEWIWIGHYNTNECWKLPECIFGSLFRGSVILYSLHYSKYAQWDAGHLHQN